MPLRSSPEVSTVRAEVFCPACVERVEQPVRFLYGDGPRSHRLGDAVTFGPGAIGFPGGHQTVVCDGQVEPPCARCGYDGAWPVEVWLEQGRLSAVRPPSRRFNWVVVPGTFIVVA